jgi:CheY-like chemotaxis protein
MTQDGETAANAGANAFVRVLAHELRNYIAPMHNAMHLLRLKAKGDPTLPPVIDLMERQLRGMIGALEAVSEADRVRRSATVLDRAPADLHDLVEQALRALPSTSAPDRSRVKVAIEPGVPQLDVDGPRFTRALAGVIDNGLRYSPTRSTVDVRGRRIDGAVEVEVEDRGAGIPAAMREQVTEFFAAPHQSGHGLGLGLPLAAAIVRLHGGTLSLESPGAEGTRVRIRLPISPGDTTSTLQSAHANAPEAVPQAGTAPKTGRRVLIADDSAAVRASLADLLQEMGHEVRAAADGAEAVSMAEEWQPDFVLLDIHMPRLSGFEAARELRARFPSSAMRLVMMSGENLDDVVRRGAREAGFDHCIDKGLAIGDLTGLLAR